MSLPLEKAGTFSRDFALQALYYDRQAGADVARSFHLAVDSQLRLLCSQPEIGRLRHFNDSKLPALRSFPVPVPTNSYFLSRSPRNTPSRSADGWCS
jgi:plasmid stabilization system protein ParE